MSENLFFEIQDLVLQAGDLLRDAGSDKEVREKEGNANYVTKYDLKIQRFLIENLQKVCPEAAFLCEEDGYKDTPVGDGYTFIIDPIDGTTNFICDFKMSVVSVALAYQGEAVMGFVFNPFSRELFTACKDKGAYLNGRRIRIPDRSLKEGVTICSIASYNTELRDTAFQAVKAVSYHTMDIREIGSAGIGICYVACSRAVAYAAPLINSWDYAAGALIAEESGALCCDWNGSPLDYKVKGSFLVAAPKAAEEYLKILKNLDQK